MRVNDPSNCVVTGNLGPTQAYEAMLCGKIVRRFNGNMAQKYYRVTSNREVQVADTTNKMIHGEWQRASTDIDSWYNSTYRVVVINAQIMEIFYE